MAPARKVAPGEITIMGAGVLALVCSFLDFYSADVGSGGVSAWSSGLFPVATLMVVFVVIMALQVALAKFTSARPEPPFGFTWEQVHLVLGFFAMLYAIAFVLMDRGFNTDLGIGFWGILVACVAAFVGAVLLRRERGGGLGH
jgi:hypothetical protein